MKLTEVLNGIAEISRETRLRLQMYFMRETATFICYDSRVLGEAQRAIKAGSSILKACADVGGSITGEHGVGVEKIEEMHYVFSDTDLSAQIQLRSVFNPLDLCISGKLLRNRHAVLKSGRQRN